MVLYLSLFALLAGVALLAWRDIAAAERQKKLRRTKRTELRWRPQFRKRLLMDKWSLRKARRLTDQRSTTRDDT